MQRKIKNYIFKIKDNIFYKRFKLIMNILIPFGFSIYNGVLGFYFNIIWNQAIFFYYLLLLVIRFSLTLALNKKDGFKKVIHIITFIVMIVLNICLIAPAVLMLKNEKPVNVDMIFAIAMAAYTTYSISKSIYEMRKYKNDDNILVKDLKLVGLINAIVSILTLQNTLIVVNGGMEYGMIILSTVSTFCLLILSLIICFQSFLSSFKDSRRSG